VRRGGHTVSGITEVKPVEEETTYGLSPEQLAHLLAMGLHQKDKRGSGEVSRTNSDMLEDMLKSELPLDPAIPESLPAVLKRPCEELSDVAGQTLSQLLLSPETDLAVIRALKDYGKALSRRGARKSGRAGAIVIYYAAIASALVFHRHKITRHSYETLREALLQLAKKNWISAELRELLRMGREACR
jgi:hypothetical protein